MSEVRINKINIIQGRPDLAWYRSDRKTPQPGVTRAKHQPKYIYGMRWNAALIHKIAYVNLHWYEVESGGNNLIRLDSPNMVAHTVCGTCFYIKNGRVTTCETPDPKAAICGRCCGELPTLSPRNPNRRTSKDAKEHLGCMVMA